MNGNYLEVHSTLRKLLLRARYSKENSIIQYWVAPSLFSTRWLQALNEQFWFLWHVLRREQRRIIFVGPRPCWENPRPLWILIANENTKEKNMTVQVGRMLRENSAATSLGLLHSHHCNFRLSNSLDKIKNVIFKIFSSKKWNHFSVSNFRQPLISEHTPFSHDVINCLWIRGDLARPGWGWYLHQ